MKPVKLTLEIGNQSQSITFDTLTPNLEGVLNQFISKVLQSQITIEKTEGPKEQLLNEVEKIDYNQPRPAPLGNHRSGGMSDPFQGTSWGVNK